MPNQDETIYQEELVRIIRPIKSRIFSEEYEKHETYGENGVKIILLLRKKL